MDQLPLTGTSDCEMLIVDGKHALWRSADAFSDLSIKSGDSEQKTGAIYGFLAIAVRAWRRFGGMVVVAWDDWEEGPAFRRSIFPGYKRRAPADAVKSEMLETMARQQQRLIQLLGTLGIRQVVSPQWEADDVIAALCAAAERTESATVILSGDRDLLQLVSARTRLARPAKGGQFIVETPETILAEWGCEPRHILDIKALAGDPGDCIPGARGIGPKTAIKLLSEHGWSWERVLAWAAIAEPSSSRVIQSLRENRHQVTISSRLVRLNDTCPLRWLPVERDQKAVIQSLFQLKFRSLLQGGKTGDLLAMGGSSDSTGATSHE